MQLLKYSQLMRSEAVAAGELDPDYLVYKCEPVRPIEAIRRLRREGWGERPGKGSHLLFRKDGRRVVVAQHPGDIPTGTLREICRRAGWEWPPNA